MLRLTTTLILFSTINIAGLAQQSVRVIQTSGNGNTRQINNTTVPVIEKKETNKNTTTPSTRAENNRKSIKPASTNTKSATRERSQNSTK